MHEKKYKIVKASQLDTNKVDNFMQLCFDKNKAAFLKQYGEWLYNGNENRYIVVEDQKPVGYFGLIPSKINIKGKEFRTLASVDLNIPIEHRGKGIMKVIDNYVKSKDSVIISFPNNISYKIYKKYGYELTSKNRIMFLPLKPILIPHYKKFKNYRKYLLRCFFIILEPFSFIFLKWNQSKSIKHSYKLENPSAQVLESIFKEQPKNIVSTVRDESFIKWRYFKSPFFSQYNFFIGGSKKSKSIVLVTRTLTHLGATQTRVIDIFGNLNDKDGLLDLIRIAIRDSIKRGASYMTSYVSLTNIFGILLKSGFLPVSRSRFRCWHSSPELVKEIMKKRVHWSLADSDNDTFD